MFDLRFSNRIENLAERLLERVGAVSGSVFEQPVVLVPNVAMRRWLTLALARRHGVCANLRFAYPAQWLWEQVARFDPQVQVSSPLDTAALTWHALAAFNDPSWYRPFPRLSAYLAESDELMRLQLAAQLAGVFSNYISYRSDWLEAWQRAEPAQPGSPVSDDETWQAALWRRVAAALELSDQNPLERFAQRLEQGAPGRLPGQVHLFCLPDLAPLHLRVLRALAMRTRVHLYAINPCSEYWFDVLDRRRLTWLAVQGQLDHHELGHRLLAGWGRQAQSHLSMLVDTFDAQIDDEDFEAPSGGTLLAVLQRSILRLEDLSAGSVPLDPQDRSIEFHECHSRSRELEVLHDRLLGLFQQHADLEPGQILVVVPDLASTAPLIDAVFGALPTDRAIPYQITGLGTSVLNPIARALLQLIQVARSRWTVNDVAGLLELPPIAARFDLDADALQRVHQWLQQSGIRWGLDADHRALLGLPVTESHTFTDGLDRLFLSYALPDHLESPFDGRLPGGSVQGSESGALGALSGFIDALARFRRLISEPASPSAWAIRLTRALEDFCDTRDCPEELQEVVGAIERFERQAQAPLAGISVGAQTVHEALARLLDDPERGGVPSGAVTFSSITSLRGLPYRVVCMLGFDDGAFPSVVRPAQFDLMADHSRFGDRQRQADERNLFLDQIIAARQYLHLSYVGRSIRDNAPYPPSVLVAELLDYLCSATASEPHDEAALGAARRRLLVRQPLQPFSERAFLPGADPRIASHNREFAEALMARHDPSRRSESLPASLEVAEDEDQVADPALRVFFNQALAPPDDDWRIVPLQSLQSFFFNPCRSLLEKRLGITLPRADDQLQDDEPFLMGWSERESLSARLLDHLIVQDSPDSAQALAEAGTEVPGGQIGREQLARQLNEFETFAQRVRPWISGALLPPFSGSLSIALETGLWRLDATFTDLRSEGLVRYRDRNASGTEYLSAWLHQLVLCAMQPASSRSAVRWLLRDTSIHFDPPDNPLEILRSLMQLYAQGLCAPLRFFPKTAWAYASNEWSHAKALDTWRPHEYAGTSEQQDPWIRLAFRGQPDPLEHDFEGFDTCARLVFEPLIAHLRHD